jgi:hypothetical protein
MPIQVRDYVPTGIEKTGDDILVVLERIDEKLGRLLAAVGPDAGKTEADGLDVIKRADLVRARINGVPGL